MLRVLTLYIYAFTWSEIISYQSLHYRTPKKISQTLEDQVYYLNIQKEHDFYLFVI